MTAVFISYRRQDSQPYARDLHSRLAARFGAERVFMDLEIGAGERWRDRLEAAVAASTVLLAVIGPRWSGGRLEDPEDWVRSEIGAGLRSGIAVVPVLVGGARLPTAEELPAELRGLPEWQAIELTDARWDYDTARLLEAVAGRLGASAGGARVPDSTPRRDRLAAAAAIERLPSELEPGETVLVAFSANVPDLSLAGGAGAGDAVRGIVGAVTAMRGVLPTRANKDAFPKQCVIALTERRIVCVPNMQHVPVRSWTHPELSRAEVRHRRLAHEVTLLAGTTEVKLDVADAAKAERIGAAFERLSRGDLEGAVRAAEHPAARMADTGPPLAAAGPIEVEELPAHVGRPLDGFVLGTKAQIVNVLGPGEYILDAAVVADANREAPIRDAYDERFTGVLVATTERVRYTPLLAGPQPAWEYADLRGVRGRGTEVIIDVAGRELAFEVLDDDDEVARRLARMVATIEAMRGAQSPRSPVA